jgi:muramoyltetrapeptide carboxypeptidase LdcA involved in peptidoglycan recycling
MSSIQVTIFGFCDILFFHMAFYQNGMFSILGDYILRDGGKLRKEKNNEFSLTYCEARTMPPPDTSLF